jgi:hypothetical protein
MSNKKPQNDEVLTSKFDIPCSIFCGSKKFLSTQILTSSKILCALRALCGEILSPWPGGETADFMTLMHTIVYRSRYQISPGSVFTGCKAKPPSTVNDSFNEVRSEKQMPPVASVRELFSSSHGGKKQRGVKSVNI